MEIVLVILLVIITILLLLILLTVSGVIKFVKPTTETTYAASIPTVTTYTQPSTDQVTPEEFDDPTLPIEQFTPDFKKPLKFVVKEDNDITTLEEEDE